MVRAMTPRPGRMREAASGLLLATEVADYLVSRGVPFRTAHEVTGRIVRELVDQGRDFSALAIADWQRYHEAFDEGVVQVITPEAAVAARVTPQSTGPAMVAKALDGTRAWIETRAPGLRA
jgi:argininosuccinate lyase